jgi:hypothetical protein
VRAWLIVGVGRRVEDIEVFNHDYFHVCIVARNDDDDITLLGKMG